MSAISSIGVVLEGLVLGLVGLTRVVQDIADKPQGLDLAPFKFLASHRLHAQRICAGLSTV